MLVLLFTAITAVGCSDDDKPEPENPDRDYVGAWKMEWDDDDEVQVIVFNEDYSVEFYGTTQELFAEGKYEDVENGSYTVNESAGVMSVSLGGERYEVCLIGSGSDLYLEIGGDQAYRISRSEVPTEKVSSGGSSSDELSGTTWKVTSMTGWGAADISSYRGMELRFGYNGMVVEWYSSAQNYSGKYTISGDMINFEGIPLVDDWGPKYTFSISGKTLTLTEPSFGTSFILARQ